jgi:hypothetical protein
MICFIGNDYDIIFLAILHTVTTFDLSDVNPSPTLNTSGEVLL